MPRAILLLASLVAVANSIVAPGASTLVVDKLVRTIDLTSASLDALTSIEISIPANSPGGWFDFALAPTSFGGRVGSLGASCASETADLESTITYGNQKPDPLVIVSVQAKPSTAASKISCFLGRPGARRPLPPQIPQIGARQKMLYESELVHFAEVFPERRHKYSAGATETTLVVLPSPRYESFADQANKPTSVNGRTLTYGPYELGKTTTPEEAQRRFRVHYELEVGVPVVTSAEREIEISHWGAVSYEDFFDVRHAGATLEGHFSRLDHQAQSPRWSFKSLIARIPKNAANLYYRDAIGNVTTSHVKRTPDNTEVTLSFRFPLYGGWHIEFYTGYSVPLATSVQKSATQDSIGATNYELVTDLGTPFRGVLTEKLTIHVVLPPGAYDVELKTPTKVESRLETRQTYLDVFWSPRPLLVIELKDVVATGDPSSLRVSYKLNSLRALEKPLVWSTVVFVFFVALIVAGRVSTPRTKGTKAVPEEKKND